MPDIGTQTHIDFPNGGFTSSDSENVLIVDDEPILCFSVMGGCDYITTLSQLKKQGYRLYDGGLWQCSKKREGSKDLTWYDVWNHDLIVSYGVFYYREDRASPEEIERDKKARKYVKNQCEK